MQSTAKPWREDRVEEVDRYLIPCLYFWLEELYPTGRVLMPYQHWDANLLVVAVTLLVVGLVVLVHYEGLSTLSSWMAKRSEHHSRRKVLYGIYFVLALHIFEIWMFGLSTWLLLKYPEAGNVAGAHPLNLLDCVYLSAVTYTTVGFGDVAPVGPIRFMAGTMALTGFVMITWSASFTYLEMARFWRK